jgi:hypothetical protein
LGKSYIDLLIIIGSEKVEFTGHGARVTGVKVCKRVSRLVLVVWLRKATDETMALEE